MLNFFKKLIYGNSVEDSTLHSDSETDYSESIKVSEGSLEAIEQRLDNRNVSNNVVISHSSIPSNDDSSNLMTDWIDDDIQVKTISNPKNVTLLDKLLLGALGAFILILGISIYIWLSGINTIDVDKIVIEAIPPAVVTAGEMQELTLIVENNNEVALLNSKLRVTYSNQASDDEGRRIRTQEIGYINTGQLKKISVPILPVGKVGEELRVQFELVYSIPDTAQEFVKDFVLNTQIEAVVISLDQNLPSSLMAGNMIPVEFAIISEKPLTDIDLQFSTTPVIDLNLSHSGIENNDITTLKIDELIAGQLLVIEGELSAMSKDVPFGVVEVEILNNGKKIFSQSYDVKIDLPPILVSADLESDYYIGQPGDFEFSLLNTTDRSVQDVEIEVEIGNWSKTNPRLGELDGSNRIIYSHERISRLKNINPEDSIDFEFSSVIDYVGQEQIEITVTGFSGMNRSRKILGTVIFDIEVKPTFEVRLDTKYYQGIYANSGPLPPRVNQVTTYTILVETDVVEESVQLNKFQAQIPSYVTIINKLPDGVIIENNIITWNNPNNRDGVQIQLAFEPLSDMVGQTPALLINPQLIYSQGKEQDLIYKIHLPTTSLDESGHKRLDAVVAQ